MQVRLFYFSQSGGNWHCTPGQRGYTKKGKKFDNGYSKGEMVGGLSYEK